MHILPSFSEVSVDGSLQVSDQLVSGRNILTLVESEQEKHEDQSILSVLSFCIQDFVSSPYF